MTVIYKQWGDVPDELKTKTSLGKMGLRLAPDQQPAAYIDRWKRVRRGWEEVQYSLYLVEEAVPKREATPAQLASLAIGRQKALQARTCQGCGMVAKHKNWLWGDLCHYCAQEAETTRYIEEAHREAVQWAQALLAGGDFVILDTETTGLPGEVIELAIIDSAGDILMNTRLNPLMDIEPGATAVHGLTKADLIHEPLFPSIYKDLSQVLTSTAQVVIYNASFDDSCLCLTSYQHGLEPPTYSSDCAMLWYAQYCGQWSDYHGSFRWQPLYGGDHTALGDCLATLKLIKQMANDREII